MATKILVVDAPGFGPEWEGAEVIKWENISGALPAEPDSAVLFAPASLRGDPQSEAWIESGASVTSAFVPDSFPTEHLARLAFLGAPRSTGVKNCLTKGSTIFTETFFQAGQAGERLDSCFRFARGKLGPKRAVDIWGALHATLFLGISTLPGQGEGGTGERVDVQLGADEGVLAFTVRFDLPEENVSAFRSHPLFSILRHAADFFELRYLQDAKKVELLALAFLSRAGGEAVEAQSFHSAAGLESQNSDYAYRGFGALGGNAIEEKRVIKGGGFKKKFSETILVAGAEKVTDPENGNFLVSGEILQPNQKVVVSGGSGFGKKAVSALAASPPAGTAKSESLLLSKIAGLEATVKQRDELIAKLNKEIEEIKDPSRMGVISGIKDNQLEGFKDNIKRLTRDLEDSEKREKDLLAVVDKAVQLKEESMKKCKELEMKLRQGQEGSNSRVAVVEKQLEEQKRQNRELAKRISQLTDQGTKAA